MLYQRGYQTYVEIKGEDGDFQIAQPYRMRVRRNNRIRCYIESRPGAEYRVVSYDTYSNHGTGGILTIDGEQTESLVFRKITAEESEHSSLNSSLNPEVRALATFSGKLGGPETQYPYMFRAEAVEETDDDSNASTVQACMTPKMAGTESYGVIQLDIVRIINFHGNKPHRPKEKDQATKSPKRKKRILSRHQTKLGDAMRCGTAREVNCKFIDTPGRPYATFEFRYCPIDVLLEKGIIKRPRRHRMDDGDLDSFLSVDVDSSNASDNTEPSSSFPSTPQSSKWTEVSRDNYPSTDLVSSSTGHDDDDDDDDDDDCPSVDLASSDSSRNTRSIPSSARQLIDLTQDDAQDNFLSVRRIDNTTPSTSVNSVASRYEVIDLTGVSGDEGR